MTDIFISYKSQRRPAIEHLAQVLECYGFSIWFDYDLLSGADFTKQIEDQIKLAKVVIVVWCPLSIESDWVKEEAALAKKLNKYLPIRIGGTECPFGFRLKDSINLEKWDGAPISAGISDLIKQLEMRIGRPARQHHDRLQRINRNWTLQRSPKLIRFPLEASLDRPRRGWGASTLKWIVKVPLNYSKVFIALAFLILGAFSYPTISRMFADHPSQTNRIGSEEFIGIWVSDKNNCSDPDSDDLYFHLADAGSKGLKVVSSPEDSYISDIGIHFKGEVVYVPSQNQYWQLDRDKLSIQLERDSNTSSVLFRCS